MKAVVIEKAGGPEVLKIQDRDIPKISSNEVLIQVKAAGINRPDIFQRQGKYPAPEGVIQDIPGLEVSGIVVEVGNSVLNIQKGERVMALVAGGGYAEYVNVDAGSCIRIPDYMSFEQAAAMPETIYTVWHNLFQRGKLKQKDNVLIHGGAGGIGSTAIILAKLFGSQVYTTVSNEEKYNFVSELGADIVINYKNENFEDILREKRIDVVLDFIGGEYFEKNINILHPDGRLVYINAMGGGKVELNIFKMMQKRLTITGSTLRNRDISFKRNLTQDIVTNLLPHLVSNQITLPIYRKFAFEQAADAHKIMEENKLLGKLIFVI